MCVYIYIHIAPDVEHRPPAQVLDDPVQGGQACGACCLFVCGLCVCTCLLMLNLCALFGYVYIYIYIYTCIYIYIYIYVYMYVCIYI